jgi:serine/threonine protein kinase
VFNYKIVLECVAEAVVAKGLKALARLVPFGESIYEIAIDAMDRLAKRYVLEAAAARKRTPTLVEKVPVPPAQVEATFKAGLEEAARLTPQQAKAEAARTVRQTCPDQPAEVQEALVSYLSQMPGVIRRSLRRPQDPTGRTVPQGMSLRKPEELLPFLPTTLPRFRPGDRTVGNWQLVELLGAGGFGEVWKAEHPQLKDLPPVALKFCLNATAAEFLRHEASLLARVMQQRNKPGIVTLRQAYLDHDPVCLEYEYVEGGDLTGVVRQLAPLPPRKRVTQACEIVRRLARAVGAAHRVDPPIVHRDLKPANVLVRKNPRGKLEFLVADFGIGGVAAHQALAAARKGTTARGALLSTALRGSHTPLYASPQQVQGEPPDVRDDVHALGVIWYQLLTGDLNAGAPTGLDWAEEVKQAGMGADLVRLLGSCVDHKPDRRPADAAALATKMTELLSAVDAVEVEEVVDVLPADPVPPRRRGGTVRENKADEEVMDALPAGPIPPGQPTRPKPARPATQRPPAPAGPPTPTSRPPAAKSGHSDLPPPQGGNKARYFPAPGLDLEELVETLSRWFAAEGFQYQALNTEDGGVLLQIQRPGGWRVWVGMATAMNVVLRQGGDQLMVEIGAGQWVDKAAVGVVSLLVLWPLAVTAAIGAWDQVQMPDKVFQQVASAVYAQKSRQTALPPPAPPTSVPPPHPAAPVQNVDVFAQLERLAALKERSIITEEEFQKQKGKLLG